MNPEQQTIIVSGASSGIGLAITHSLLDAGFTVVGLARDFSKADIRHANFKAIEIDLSDLDSLPEALTQVKQQIQQPVRALINNAGIGIMGYLEQISVADMRRLMDVNFLSHAIITKTFLPEMKQGRHGDVVFLGSEAALHGARQGSLYCASKFALRGFAQSLRDECAKSSVRVTLINPGAVRTPFFDKLDFEPGASTDNALDPDDIARTVMLVLQASPGTVFDEINLSPLTQVWQKKHN